MQHIKIRNLGPIQEIDMDIAKMNLLIGEQATGKSTVAKCIYYFRMIKPTITDYLCQLYDDMTYNGKKMEGNLSFQKILKGELKAIFISLFGFSWDLSDNLYLQYQYAEGVWIDVALRPQREATDKKYLSVRYSPELSRRIRNLEKMVHDFYKDKNSVSSSLNFASRERLKIYDTITRQVNEAFDDDRETYYIPAGRSMLTLLSNSRAGINSDNLDLITRKFVQLIETIHVNFAGGIKQVHTRYPNGSRKFDINKVSDWIINCLKADYRYDSVGKEYLLIDNGNAGNNVSINFASSGQQEILWLFNYLYVLLLKDENAFVIIEEPEAHLFPKLQDEVINFVSYFANMTGSAVLVTTHSPYILTSVNMLYMAGKIIRGDEKSRKKIAEIIGANREIDPMNFFAAKLNRRGSMESMIDEEMEELKTELIDEVSDLINEKYREIFAVGYAGGGEAVLCEK